MSLSQITARLSHRLLRYGDASDKREAKLTGQWIRDEKIKVLVDSTYEYTDADKAFERLKTGRVKGKVVIHVSEK